MIIIQRAAAKKSNMPNSYMYLPSLNEKAKIQSTIGFNGFCNVLFYWCLVVNELFK